MQQPAWLTAAWAEFGVREVVGSGDAVRVVKYFRDAGHAQITNDETPWCAAFVGAMLKRAEIEGSGSLLARSYLKWGVALDEPKLGAIAVLTRGSDLGAGHVGFYLGSTNDNIYLLGGNQGDAVSVAAFARERLLGYRWPAPQKSPADASKVADIQRSDVFARALTHVQKMEGGYSDDPYDPGGPTNRGVTLAVFAKWHGETVDAASRARLIDALKRIPDETVQRIYNQRYWQPSSAGLLPEPLALMHFDASVNHGVGGAIRMLQSAVGTTSDGEIGPQTLAAIAAMPSTTSVARYAEIRRARYRALPHFWRFGRGWLRRVDATEALAKAWAMNEGPTPKTTTSTSNSEGDSRMANDTGAIGTAEGAKWWAQSKTIWGAIITAVATVAPLLGPVIGVDLPGEVVKDAGEQTVTAVQAVVGLIGTLLTIYGRLKATTPLARRALSVKL
ncbi:MAG: TIGR02594 family protein [Hyphomicrobium sp.]|nr:MAG: TIGR02594 family protein [Hyphomicrobium sp.]PPC99828.1 MAG: TIGR02594 family protein [Hyphomicrobium sp.]